MKGKRTRDASIEVYRCCLMFGICLLHAIGFSGNLHPWFTNMLVACVDGFVFISGYFGIRFSWKRFFRIWGVALACSVIVTVFYDGFLGAGVPSGVAFVKAIHARLFCHWFLNCYAVLMLLCPMLNYVTEKADRNQILQIGIPFCVLVFVWCWGGSYMEKFGVHLPKPWGFGSYTYLMMSVVYVIGRLCRRFDCSAFLTPRRKTALLLGCAAATSVGLSGYVSPFAMGLAVAVFAVFKSIRWPTWIGRLAVFLGPSMFAVYLYHAENEGRDIVARLTNYFIEQGNTNIWVAQLLIAVILFGGCVVLDVCVRRSLAWIGIVASRKFRE